MLKTTTQQLLEKVWDGPEEIGRPVLIGAPVDGNLPAQPDDGIAILKAVPKGYVVLVTRFVAQAHGVAGISGALGTKGTIFGSPTFSPDFGADFEQTTGTVEGTALFYPFARFNTLFGAAASPDWRTAPPSNTVSWQPKYPVVLPSGWKANTRKFVGEWFGSEALYGILVSENDARSLGFAVSNTATDTERIYGIASSNGSGGTEELVAGRTGKAIRILDIYVRSQPRTNALNTITLQQATDTRAFLKIHSSNPAEMIDEAISPDIYLKAGDALQMVTTSANMCSVTVTYEFVDADQVPGDAWWVCVDPDVGTPTEGTTGVDSVFTTKTNPATLYYPRLDDLGETATKTTPGKGRQHLLRGYVVSAQKDGSVDGTADDVDQQILALVTAGSSSVGVGFGNSSALGVNIEGDIAATDMLSPMFMFSTHNQTLTAKAENINMPCRRDTGTIRVDVIGMSAAPTVLGSHVTPGDGDITAWSVCMWGKTIPNRFRNPVRRTF